MTSRMDQLDSCRNLAKLPCPQTHPLETAPNNADHLRMKEMKRYAGCYTIASHLINLVNPDQKSLGLGSLMTKDKEFTKSQRCIKTTISKS